MKFLVVFLCAIIVASIASVQQVTKDDRHGINPIIDKLAQIDKANQILPMVLTKAQLQKLLPKIERCRDNIRNQEKKEADRLKAMAADIDKVHAEAAKGVVPSHDFLNRVSSVYAQFEQERTGVKAANAMIMNEAIDQILDAGQKKRIHSIVDKVFNAKTQKWEDATEGEKLTYFALSVLLDDDAYQFLVKLNQGM